nr:hypothetical protein [Neobacillus sp. Marseille-Q6967]
MNRKHIIIIHGRAMKPQRKVKEELVLTSLVEGIRRIDKKVAKAIEEEQIKVTLIYYGDISNGIMVKKKPEVKKGMVEIDGKWYLPDDAYDKPLKKLLKRPLEDHTEDDYSKLLEKEEGNRIKLGDDLAPFVSQIFASVGVTERLIAKKLPDLHSYLNSRVVGSEIRERLQCKLKEAFLAGDDIALVSHSMGCIVAYDVLWKFSRMSEYRDFWDKKIPLWMTLGNPLGEESVQERVYDADEPKDGKYPKNIINWVNINAKDDYIAHDGDIEDDFGQMKSRDLIKKIEDIPRIHTFWVDDDGKCNPHKLYGYLNHPTVAEKLINWISD